MGALSNFFGYILDFIYNLTSNYGVAIIIFSILLKIVLLPVSVKQQRTMIKTSKIQGKIKEVQTKFKKDPQKMNQEVMAIYKKENMSPFSGCLSAIIQIVLLLAMFYLVRSPLTHMKKIDPVEIDNFKNELSQQEITVDGYYPEISIIKYAHEQGLTDSPFYINMEFLGIDLSNIPKEKLNNPTVYIIPVLYVISSVISIRLTTSMAKKQKEKEVIEIKDDKAIAKKEPEMPEMPDMATQMNKNMTWLIPIMSVSISFIAPLRISIILAIK